MLRRSPGFLPRSSPPCQADSQLCSVFEPRKTSDTENVTTGVLGGEPPPSRKSFPSSSGGPPGHSAEGVLRSTYLQSQMAARGHREKGHTEAQPHSDTATLPSLQPGSSPRPLEWLIADVLSRRGHLSAQYREGRGPTPPCGRGPGLMDSQTHVTGPGAERLRGGGRTEGSGHQAQHSEGPPGVTCTAHPSDRLRWAGKARSTPLGVPRVQASSYFCSGDWFSHRET